MDSLRANWRRSEIWVSSGGCIRGKGYWPWEVRQSWSVSHSTADLLIGADRTRFSVCTRRLASEESAPDQGSFICLTAVSAHSCLPEQNLWKVSWACIAEWLLKGKGHSAACACIQKGNLTRVNKLTSKSLCFKSSSWRGLQRDALTFQMQDNLHTYPKMQND